MATIQSLPALKARKAPGVELVSMLADKSSYKIPSPILSYNGEIDPSDPVWVNNFAIELEGNSPEIGLYRLTDSFITVNGAIFTGGSFIVKESLYPYIRRDDVIKAFYPNLILPDESKDDSMRFCIRAVSRQDGPLCFAREHGEAGYFHWLHSVIPRITQYQAYGLSEPGFILAVTERFQSQSLEFIGVKPEQQSLSRGTTVFCDDMFFCSPMVSPDLGRSGGFFERSLYATESLRSLVKGLPFKNRKLFISREDAKIRRLLVEADVVELLSRYGFEVVTLTGMSFVDQMQLFASASVVVSMHGAGLSNIAFMPPSGLVVELLAPDRLWPTYRGIAARAGLHYSPYVGRRAGNIVDRDSDLDVDLHHFVDFVVRSMDAVQSS